MSSSEVKFSDVTFPVLGESSFGDVGVFRLTGSTTAQVVFIPYGLLGTFIDITSVGANAQCGFFTGSVAPALTWNGTSRVDAVGGMTSSYGAGFNLLDSQPRSGMVPSAVTAASALQQTASLTPLTSKPTGFVYISAPTASGSFITIERTQGNGGR